MQRILIQLDTDPHPSSFDRVVAVDAGVEHLFSYGGVTPDNVEALVHGAMFTRGPKDLKNTAIFVGGSNVSAGEAVFAAVQKIFFGPMRVSVMMDSNGSNTTAAAAVLAAARHRELKGTNALVLGGTGPVGQRAAELLALEGASVRVGSRSVERARQTCDVIAHNVPGSRLAACETDTAEGLSAALQGTQVVIAAGAPGIELLSREQRESASDLAAAIDLNAVPPLGIAGVEVTAKADDQDGVICYGAIGVGGSKMKIHKACIRRLFDANDAVLETRSIFEIGREVSK